MREACFHFSREGREFLQLLSVFSCPKALLLLTLTYTYGYLFINFRVAGVKRLMDLVLAGLGVVLLAPLFLVVALLVMRSMGSPVFFRQIRPGLHGKPFAMLKFRTMHQSVGADGKLLPDDLRLTKLGKILRSTSIDELPQLWNVLRGDMSLVGPRPLLLEDLPACTGERARRHDVLPGITGWAQINGRNAVERDQKANLDIWYVDNQSFLLDLSILLMTIPKVLRRDGIHKSQAKVNLTPAE